MKLRRRTTADGQPRNPERYTWRLYAWLAVAIILAGAIVWVRVADSAQTDATSQLWCQRVEQIFILGAQDRQHTDELFAQIEQVEAQVAAQYPKSPLTRQTIDAFQHYFAERAKDDKLRAASPIPDHC